MPLKLLALILPLSLDTFAVSAAMGVAGLDRRRRLRLSLLLSGFEAVMPLLGFLAGAALGGAVGGAAEWLAVVVLAAVGLYILVADDDVALSSDRLRRVDGWSMLGLGLSVSVDELAIGLAAGLAGLPVLVVVVVIAVQAFVAAQLGTRLGARVGARIGEGAERLAGGVLLLLAAALAVLRLSGRAG